MADEIRDAQLEEDHHTRLRYLSWRVKVDGKWESRSAVVRPGESHPILDERKSLQDESRLT
jgi:hypothetical protein